MSLNNFLGAAEQEAEPRPQPEQEAPQQQPEQGRQEPEHAEPEPQEPDAGAEGGAATDGEGDDGEPADVRGLRSAVQTVRRERNDYKGQVDRISGELAAERRERERMAAEVEALRKQYQQAPPQQQQPAPAEVVPADIPIPNPLEDPQGFIQYQQHLQQRVLFNERLNNSEMALRSQIPDEDVDEKLAVFKKACDENPALRAELARQIHPYRWAYQTAQRIMAMNEIGTDPAAYKAKTEGEMRARLEAEIRAKLEEEMRGAAPPAQQQQPARQQPNIPGSLGTARSAAPRAVAVEGAPTLDQIFAPNRKR